MTQYKNGNGARTETSRAQAAPLSLGDHAQEIHQDAEALAAAVREATSATQEFLEKQIEDRPYTTLGVAVGVGYVLGGGLSARLPILALGVAARVAAAAAAREIGARLMQTGTAPPTKHGPREPGARGTERA